MCVCVRLGFWLLCGFNRHVHGGLVGRDRKFLILLAQKQHLRSDFRSLRPS